VSLPEFSHNAGEIGQKGSPPWLDTFEEHMESEMDTGQHGHGELGIGRGLAIENQGL
jgi:hypothetical protein